MFVDRRALGVLYNEENSMLETAFNSSVDVAKARMASRDVRLNVAGRIVPLYDSFDPQHFGECRRATPSGGVAIFCLSVRPCVSLVACEILAGGVSAVFGPTAGDTAPIVQSICDYKEIPHVQTRWDVGQRRGSCQINLYPHPSTLAKVIHHARSDGIPRETGRLGSSRRITSNRPIAGAHQSDHGRELGELHHYLREQRQPRADHQHPEVAADQSSDPHQTTRFGAELPVIAR